MHPDAGAAAPTGPTLQGPAPAPRRGCANNTLRGGVHGGDPNGPHVPRCGAKTRGARGGRPCRGPAMANGRCRLHGGWSRGPVTAAGRARAAAANLRHGACSAATRAFLAEMHALRAEAARLVAEHNGRQRHKRRAATTAPPDDGDPT